jgi:subtilase family serine protease
VCYGWGQRRGSFGSPVASGAQRAVPDGCRRRTPSYLDHAADLGPAALAGRAQALIALQHRNQAGPLRFIAEVSDPHSRLYERYLTPAQFVVRYAPSQATVRAVKSFARGYGLRVVEVPSNRAYVYVKGTIGSMERAFSTRIDTFKVNGRFVQAPVRAVRIPARFAGLVTGVDELDTGDVVRPLKGLHTPPPPAYVNAPPQSAYWGEKSSTAPGLRRAVVPGCGAGL